MAPHSALFSRKALLVGAALNLLSLLIFPLLLSMPAQAEETPPSSAEPVSSDDDPRIPQYQKMRPAWAVELNFSTKSFGGKATPTQGDANIPGVTVRVEYQPQFIQGFGILGIGPSLNFYSVPSSANLSSKTLALYSAGGQVRYQARYLRNQWVVPMAGFAAEYVHFDFDNAKGGAVATGPFFGGMLLLNIFEPSAAAEFYADKGVQRSYLVAEIRNLTAKDATLNFTGNSYYFGLRTEF